MLCRKEVFWPMRAHLKNNEPPVTDGVTEAGCHHQEDPVEGLENWTKCPLNPLSCFQLSESVSGKETLKRWAGNFREECRECVSLAALAVVVTCTVWGYLLAMHRSPKSYGDFCLNTVDWSPVLVSGLFACQIRVQRNANMKAYLLR